MFVGLIHIGDLHFIHPALNWSTLNACILIINNGLISKIDFVSIEPGVLPHVLPPAVHLIFVDK